MYMMYFVSHERCFNTAIICFCFLLFIRIQKTNIKHTRTYKYIQMNTHEIITNDAVCNCDRLAFCIYFSSIIKFTNELLWWRGYIVLLLISFRRNSLVINGFIHFLVCDAKDLICFFFILFFLLFSSIHLNSL